MSTKCSALVHLSLSTYLSIYLSETQTEKFFDSDLSLGDCILVFFSFFFSCSLYSQ